MLGLPYPFSIQTNAAHTKSGTPATIPGDITTVTTSTVNVVISAIAQLFVPFCIQSIFQELADRRLFEQALDILHLAHSAAGKPAWLKSLFQLHRKSIRGSPLRTVSFFYKTEEVSTD